MGTTNIKLVICSRKGRSFHDALHEALVECTLAEGLTDDERRKRRALRDTVGALLPLVEVDDHDGVLRQDGAVVGAARVQGGPR